MPVLFVGNKKDLVDRRNEEQKVVNFRQVYLSTSAIFPTLDYIVPSVARSRRWLMPMAIFLQLKSVLRLAMEWTRLF